MLWCKYRVHFFWHIALTPVIIFCSLAYAEFPAFEYHQIGRIGNQMGQTSLVDVDKDGDLDEWHEDKH